MIEAWRKPTPPGSSMVVRRFQLAIPLWHGGDFQGILITDNGKTTGKWYPNIY